MGEHNSRMNTSSAGKQLPVLGFAAWSGTGKTTLLRKLIPALRDDGVRVGVLKHAHHNFDVDQPGKDSYELRHAGASHVLIGSRKRWALMVERTYGNDGEADEPDLQELLSHMPTSQLDLILVEGFKHEQFAKIELHRSALARPLLFPDDENIIAIASDAAVQPAPGIAVLDLNNLSELKRFVLAFAAYPAKSRT